MKPPSYKPKLPNHLSFPIGYDAISDAFALVPFTDEIRLHFWNDWAFDQSKFRGVLESAASYPIVTGVYTKWDKRLGVEFGGKALHSGVWELRVHPVRRELKSVARRELLRTGLHSLAQWFVADRPSSWYWGEKQCELDFHPGSGTITLHEKVVKT